MSASGVVPLALTIERAELLHFLGYPEGHEPPARIASLLDSTLAEARARVRARGAWALLDLAKAGSIGLEPIDASGLVIGLVTIGDDVERRASELIRAGAATEALLMDAAGSAAVEEAADRLGSLIVDGTGSGLESRPHADGDGVELRDPIPSDAGPAPAAISCRVSPGYGKWPLAAQRALLRLLPHRELGVELLPTMLMVPRKSVSFAMWLGADARPLAGLSGCARCELENCRYRRA